jgi:hypothetical protein
MVFNRLPYETTAMQEEVGLIDYWDPHGGDYGEGGPAGTLNVMTKRYVDIKWEFEEAEPKGSCIGFEVAIFVGDNIDDGTLVRPIEFIDDPTARRYLCILELKNQVVLKAAVRACYGYIKSKWVPSIAGSAFTPNTQTYSTNGTLKLSDGTIMQWFTSGNLVSQNVYTLLWPTPFPNGCYCATVTPVTQSANFSGNDNWLQIVSKSATEIQLYKQSATNSANNMAIQAHVIGFGY